ncbi:MAG: hypothetical protein KAW41_00635 [Candidatus Diapherotrites archaeon]|nr:hypothetical protein [Candidatus Diapherotrites archaeon]
MPRIRELFKKKVKTIYELQEVRYKKQKKIEAKGIKKTYKPKWKDRKSLMKALGYTRKQRKAAVKGYQKAMASQKVRVDRGIESLRPTYIKVVEGRHGHQGRRRRGRVVLEEDYYNQSGAKFQEAENAVERLIHRASTTEDHGEANSMLERLQDLQKDHFSRALSFTETRNIMETRKKWDIKTWAKTRKDFIDAGLTPTGVTLSRPLNEEVGARYMIAHTRDGERILSELETLITDAGNRHEEWGRRRPPEEEAEERPPRRRRRPGEEEPTRPPRRRPGERAEEEPERPRRRPEEEEPTPAEEEEQPEEGEGLLAAAGEGEGLAEPGEGERLLAAAGEGEAEGASRFEAMIAEGQLGARKLGGGGGGGGGGAGGAGVLSLIVIIIIILFFLSLVFG